MRGMKRFIETGGLIGLIGSDLRVLMVLVALADEDHRVAATQVQIADLAGVSRKTARAALDRLIQQCVVSHSSRRGKQTDYTVLPSYAPVRNGTPEGAKRMAPSRAKWVPSYPQDLGTSEGAKSGEQMAPPEVPSPKGNPSRVLSVPSGPHPHHSFAVSALTTLIAERSLGLDIDELLRHAYRLGNGDPWNGYLSIKNATEEALGDDVRDPAALTLWRLRKAKVIA